MFKNRQFKIKVSGCSGFIFLGLLLLCIIALLLTVPLFGFFGLSILLAKYELAHLDLYDHWYRNALYFGWFLLLVLAVVFVIDLLGLFTMASMNMDYNTGVSIISTLVQYGICLFIFHQILVNLFNRIEFTWLGSAITVAVIYLITSALTTTTIIEEPKND